VGVTSKANEMQASLTVVGRSLHQGMAACSAASWHAPHDRNQSLCLNVLFTKGVGASNVLACNETKIQGA
jgi:hypothetical protein